MLATIKGYKDNIDNKAHWMMVEVVVPFGNVPRGVNVPFGGRNSGSSSSVSFDVRENRSSSIVQFGARASGFRGGVPFDSKENKFRSGVFFGAAENGFRVGIPFDFRANEFHGGVSFGVGVSCSRDSVLVDAMASGSRGRDPLDDMIITLRGHYGSSL